MENMQTIIAKGLGQVAMVFVSTQHGNHLNDISGHTSKIPISTWGFIMLKILSNVSNGQYQSGQKWNVIWSGNITKEIACSHSNYYFESCPDEIK